MSINDRKIFLGMNLYLLRGEASFCSNCLSVFPNVVFISLSKNALSGVTALAVAALERREAKESERLLSESDVSNPPKYLLPAN